MAGVIPFLPAIIGGIGSLLGGIGNSQPKTVQTGSQTNQTSTTEANLTRQQRKIMRQLADIIRAQLEAGPTVPQYERDLGRTQINQSYNTMAPRLESALTSRGFGESGRLGAGFKGLEIGRANAFQGLEGQLRGEAQQRFQQMLGLASGFIQPHNFTTTASGTTTGTQTLPGQSLLSSLGGAAGDIGSLLLLRSLLGGGGGGSSIMDPNVPDWAAGP